MKKVVPAAELKDHIGEPLGASSWFTIDQERIDRFAEVTEDRQFIHIDVDKAKQGPFGSTVAHGFLTLSMLSYLTAECCLMPENTMMGVNYGCDKVRFLQPVKVNQRIRARVTPRSVIERAPGQFLIKSEVTVDIDGEDKPALIADWLGLWVTA